MALWSTPTCFPGMENSIFFNPSLTDTWHILCSLCLVLITQYLNSILNISLPVNAGKIQITSNSNWRNKKTKAESFKTCREYIVKPVPKGISFAHYPLLWVLWFLNESVTIIVFKQVFCQAKLSPSSTSREMDKHNSGGDVPTIRVSFSPRECGYFPQEIFKTHRKYWPKP